MVDLLASLVHFCASCVSDNNVIPPALGALGGAAGAAGGLGGLGGLGGNAGIGASPGDGADGGSGAGSRGSAGAGGGGGAAGGRAGGSGGSGADAPAGNRPQPIGDTPPANGPQPIGDQGAAPDRPDGWGTGKNPDGGHTITYGGTRTTFEPGGGPVPIDDNLPGNVSDPQPIGDTPPAHGPQPIGDQGAAPDQPEGWGVGKNPDGGTTITYGGTRTTFEPGGGPVPIDDNLPGNVSDPQPIGDTPPANGPQPIGDQGAAPDQPDGWGTGNNPDGGHTITYGGTRTTFEPGGGPVPIDDNLPGNVSDPQPIGDTPPAHGPQPIGDTPPANGPQPIGNAPSTTADASPNDQPPSGDTQPTGDSTPVPDTQPSDASPATDNPQSPNAPTTIRTPDGTVTTIQPDGSTNVESTLPPSGGGLTTGPGATDPNDPQQGQQPIGFTHQVLGPMSPSDPTSSISDMPNTAHIQGTAAPGATPAEPGTSPTGSTSAGSTAHKPHTP